MQGHTIGENRAATHKPAKAFELLKCDKNILTHKTIHILGWFNGLHIATWATATGKPHLQITYPLGRPLECSSSYSLIVSTLTTNSTHTYWGSELNLPATFYGYQEKKKQSKPDCHWPNKHCFDSNCVLSVTKQSKACSHAKGKYLKANSNSNSNST